ncbi:winged helix-turn-helix domain-containing protein [Halomarina rubra]|uniref:Winged helix-turn-helix domain-containing protein n=1 Tax=Halomarina rubra TaxID=2071873 RepID=A0ABD6ASK7_9EURY|nr:winged helix-turn-helix domain-containing protein [Halomarina rubra]
MATTDDSMRLSLPTDEEILRELRDGEGQNLPSNVADEIARDAKHVNTRLVHLEDYGLVENIGRGVYRITPLGRLAFDHIDEYSHDTNDEFELMIRRKLGGG